MDFKKNITNLSKDIEDIENFVSKIENNSHITLLEMDILKAKIHELYGTLLEFEVGGDTGNLDTDAVEEASINDLISKEIEEKAIDEKLIENPEISIDEGIIEDQMPEVSQLEVESEVIKNEIPPQTDPPVAEEFVDEVDVTIENKEIIEEKTVPEKDPVQIKKKIEPEVIADLYMNTKRFRNESIQKDNTQDISSKFHSQPISDISLAIGLNDKFRYVRELFEGDNLQYAETLRFLNNVKSETEAVDYLNEQFEWDMETKLVKSLLELTSRKLKMTDNG